MAEPEGHCRVTEPGACGGGAEAHLLQPNVEKGHGLLRAAAGIALLRNCQQRAQMQLECVPAAGSTGNSLPPARLAPLGPVG